MLSFQKTSARNLTRQTEEALEHLLDFAYLGNHPLCHLECVQSYLPKSSKLSHIDRGRALHLTLREAINTLRSEPGFSSDAAEARHYSLLDLAYVRGESNERTAGLLQISVRTFYRERNKAIRVIAQILEEWESSAGVANHSSFPE